MEGFKFNTQEEFLYASQKNDLLGNLSISKVLGRIYSISELRQIAKDIQINNIDRTIHGLGGGQ